MRMICFERNVHICVIPRGWKKVRHTMIYHQNFIHGTHEVWTFWRLVLEMLSDSREIFRFTPWNPLGFRKVQIRANTFHGWPSAKVNHDPSGSLTHRKIFTSCIRWSLFFWLCWSPWSIPNLSMHCTWNSLINLEKKNKDLESESFFRKTCKNLPWKRCFIAFPTVSSFC